MIQSTQMSWEPMILVKQLREHDQVISNTNESDFWNTDMKLDTAYKQQSHLPT